MGEFYNDLIDPVKFSFWILLRTEDYSSVSLTLRTMVITTTEHESLLNHFIINTWKEHSYKFYSYVIKRTGNSSKGQIEERPSTFLWGCLRGIREVCRVWGNLESKLCRILIRPQEWCLRLFEPEVRCPISFIISKWLWISSVQIHHDSPTPDVHIRKL